jgi:plastocyanin
MRGSSLGILGALLLVGGILAVAAGGVMGGTTSSTAPAFDGLFGGNDWMGPGMMGGWGGGSTDAAPSSTPPSSQATGSATIRMAGEAFAPSQLSVTVGTTVTWINDDDEPHTVTAADGSWSSGYMAPGASYTRTFGQAGSYAYVCLYHPWMRGTVTAR